MTTGVAGDVVPLVGRRMERAVLHALLERAGNGSGGIVVLEGEAGIGKTRLVAELADEAGRRGLRVLVGAVDEIEGERPFGPFVDALGLHPHAPDAERAALGRLIAGESSDAPSPSADDVGFRIVESLVGPLERLAAPARTGGDYVAKTPHNHRRFGESRSSSCWKTSTGPARRPCGRCEPSGGGPSPPSRSQWSSPCVRFHATSTSSW